MIGHRDLQAIGQARWTAPLLNHLLNYDGARFAELLGGLGIARDSLVRTLQHVIEQGWVTRNPGHGHPLRPEYILTSGGLPVAAFCARLIVAQERFQLAPQSLTRWSVPILVRLREGWARFSVLQRDLEPVTARALSMSLKAMIDGDLVARRLEDDFPPATFYGLAPVGIRFLNGLT